MHWSLQRLWLGAAAVIAVAALILAGTTETSSDWLVIVFALVVVALATAFAPRIAFPAITLRRFLLLVVVLAPATVTPGVVWSVWLDDASTGVVLVSFLGFLLWAGLWGLILRRTNRQ